MITQNGDNRMSDIVLYRDKMESDLLVFIYVQNSECITNADEDDQIISILTNKNFYITYEVSSGVGFCPTNLPSPARWFKDEAIKATKGN